MYILLIMKKYIILLTCFFSTTSLYAKGRLGIQVAPAVSFGRTYTAPNEPVFSSKGAALRFKAGTIYDYPFQDNYNLSTGILYSTQRFSLQGQNPSSQETHELHYLQVPVLFKPYTSEVALDVRIYSTIGVVGQVLLAPINTKKERNATLLASDFRRFGLAGLFGVGVEYDALFSTSVFAGISYQHGLMSLVCTTGLASYGDLISIDLGARF